MMCGATCPLSARPSVPLRLRASPVRPVPPMHVRRVRRPPHGALIALERRKERAMKAALTAPFGAAARSIDARNPSGSSTQSATLEARRRGPNARVRRRARRSG